MELDQNQENANTHERILHSLLDYLKTINLDLIRREALSIHIEPEKSYMLEFEGKVSRALKRQRIRLQLPTPALPKEEKTQIQYEPSTSGTGTSRSKSQTKGEKEKNTLQEAPRSKALLHKIKNQQRPRREPQL